jgi:hypothetical protein
MSRPLDGSPAPGRSETLLIVLEESMSALLVCYHRPMCKRPRLPRFRAQDVGIKQAQIGPRLQLDADLG